MTNYEYACWIRGYLQLCPDASLTFRRLQILKNHLNLAAVVSGGLGEKNQVVFNRIVEMQQTPANELAYKTLKQLLHDTYFDS
jgi:altronate dehydratase